jgi:DNA-binding CsgD family transcriptional regulator
MTALRRRTSRRAIDRHLERIFAKLGLENRTATAGIALEVPHGRNRRHAPFCDR